MHTTTTTVVVTAEEALLLRRVADGDHGEPLVALYHRYASRLYGLGLRLMGDAGMAEELVQEFLLRLWRSARRYDAERGSVRTFLFAIARRVAVDLLRRTASRPLPTGTAAEGIASGEEAFDSLVLGFDVRDALEALAPKQRQVLQLILDEDLGQADLAKGLGIPVGTVKTRIFYGLRALRVELERRGLY